VAYALADVPGSVVALEINLSCPNLEGRRGIFAHDAQLSADVVRAVAGATDRPCWAKLSPNTDRVVEVAGAVHDAGAEAVTLANTLLGMVIDERTGLPALAVGGGGYSGAPVHPVVVRIVHDVHAALPDLPIVGVGGVRSGWDAAELLLAGASAVQVGTASFAEPRAAERVLRELADWCARRGVTPAQLRGLAHRGGLAD
jgi:dihydroorotate dehydrogenase (NAD+) catalytic subunit